MIPHHIQFPPHTQSRGGDCMGCVQQKSRNLGGHFKFCLTWYVCTCMYACVFEHAQACTFGIGKWPNCRVYLYYFCRCYRFLSDILSILKTNVLLTALVTFPSGILLNQHICNLMYHTPGDTFYVIACLILF